VLALKQSRVAADSLDVLSSRSLKHAAIGLTVLALGCGSTGGKSPSPAPVPPPRPKPAGPTLQDARLAEEQGRLTEALALYDTVAVRESDKTARVTALAHSAALRLSTDPARRDLTRAQATLAEVARLEPRFPTPVPAATLVAFLEDAQALRTRADALDAALNARDRRAVQASQRQQDQKAAALRNENRQLKEEIKTLQAELARKEEALRRTAEKLLNTPPYQQ
jgi:hypothetical protein